MFQLNNSRICVSQLMRPKPRLPFLPDPHLCWFPIPLHSPLLTGRFSKTQSQSCHSLEPYIISQCQQTMCKTSTGINLFLQAFLLKPLSPGLYRLCSSHTKIPPVGNSLAVQWLGLCTLTAKGPGSIPGGELRSHKPRGVATKQKTEKNIF